MIDLGNVFILGDSYSTFEGYIPKGYNPFYRVDEEGSLDTGLHDVKYTWWYRLKKDTKLNLIENNSWSGSTISYTGYDNLDCSETSSFITRLKKRINEGFFEKNKIDTLFVFGGTNDSWTGGPMGSKESDDLYSAVPAVYYLAEILKDNFKNTRIIFIINTNLKKEIEDALIDASKINNLEYLLLKDFDKKSDHPTIKGMEEIENQLLKFLGNN